jgi:hypothetical protein
MDPQSEHVLNLGYSQLHLLVPVDGGEPREPGLFPANEMVTAGAFSPSGHLVAAASLISDGQATLQVWDLETDEIRVFDQPTDSEAMEGYHAAFLAFVDESTLYTSGGNGLLRWDLETGSYEMIRKAPPNGMIGMSVSADRQNMLSYEMEGFHRLEGLPSL